MVIVKMIQMKELRRLELLWREDIIIGTIGVRLENVRVGDQKQALIYLWNLRSLQLMAKTRNENGKSRYW